MLGIIGEFIASIAALRRAGRDDGDGDGAQLPPDMGPRRPDINAAAADSPPPQAAAEAAPERSQRAQETAGGEQQGPQAQPMPSADAA